MKIAVAYNKHRYGGGSDLVAQMTIDLISSKCGYTSIPFVRDSKQLKGLPGKFKAFASGCYASRGIESFTRMLEDAKPDLVHAHEVYPLISPWIFKVCKEKNIPVVMSCHDYRISCPIATHFRSGKHCYECSDHNELRCIRHNCCDSMAKSSAYAIRNFIARKNRLFSDYVDLFLTPTEAARQIMITHSPLSPDKTHVLPYAVTNVSAPRNENQLGDYIAFAGRNAYEKGVDNLIEAARLVGKPLKLAGDFSDHPLSKQDLPNVEFVGLLNRSEIETFYKSARCVVIPSIWNETFGLVAGEAMNCGTPVIVANMEALIEVVGDCGMIFTAGNSQELADKIDLLYSSDNLCREMGAKGRARVQKEYNTQAYTEKLINYYSQVLDQGN